MIKLHATRKLFEKLTLTSEGTLPVTPMSKWLYEKPTLDINSLSGWHGHLVTLQRRNCILMAHDSTRFPLVLPALTKPDFAELNDATLSKRSKDGAMAKRCYADSAGAIG